MATLRSGFAAKELTIEGMTRMPLRFYVAVINQSEPDGVFGVVLLDFPGCVSYGDSVAAAAEAAIEVLALHIDGMIEAGEPLPTPSPPDAPSPEWAMGVPETTVARLLVPVEVPGSIVVANVTMDEGLLIKLDKAAAAEGRSRSGYIVRAVRDRLRESTA